MPMHMRGWKHIFLISGWQVVDATPTNMSENTDSDFWSSVKKLIDDSPQINLAKRFQILEPGLFRLV